MSCDQRGGAEADEPGRPLAVFVLVPEVGIEATRGVNPTGFASFRAHFRDGVSSFGNARDPVVRQPLSADLLPPQGTARNRSGRHQIGITSGSVCRQTECINSARGTRNGGGYHDRRLVDRRSSAVRYGGERSRVSGHSPRHDKVGQAVENRGEAGEAVRKTGRPFCCTASQRRSIRWPRSVTLSLYFWQPW